MRKLNNKQGMTYFMVIFIIAVGMILVSSMLKTALNENLQASYQADNMKAYNIARAGADVMVHRILTLHKDYWGDFASTQITEPVAFKDGEFTVSVTEISEHEYEIFSVGTYNDAISEVGAVIRLDYYFDWHYAIYTLDSMELMQIGSLGTQIASAGTIGFKNSAYDTLYRQYAEEEVILRPPLPTYDLTDVNTTNVTSGTIDSFPAHHVELTTASTIFDSVIFDNNNQEWVIDTAAADFEQIDHGDSNYTMDYVGAGGDWMVVQIDGESSILADISLVGDNNLLIIVTDGLDFKGKLSYGYDSDGDSSIDQPFSGKVEILFTDTDAEEDEFDFIFEGPNTGVGNDDTDRLTVILYDNTKTNLSVNGDFYGHIIGPGAYVEMKNAQTALYGTVICETVVVSANVQILYDPDVHGTPNKVILMQFAYWY